jgi:hypothetical protein
MKIKHLKKAIADVDDELDVFHLTVLQLYRAGIVGGEVGAVFDDGSGMIAKCT